MSDATLLPGAAQPTRGRDARDRRDSVGFAKALAFSAGRGAALVGLAVLIGIVLLQVIDDGTSGPVGDGGGNRGAAATTTTTSGGTTSSTEATTTTTGAAAVRPAGEVTVLVLNGSGRSGAAAAMTTTLKNRGYQTLTPADAASNRRGNLVYFKPSYDRECATVATVVGGNAQVQAIPSPAPSGSDRANCVVILGS